MGWLLLAIIVLVAIIGIVQGNKKMKERRDILSKQGYSIDDFVDSGKYIGGHPKIDKEMEHSSIIITKENISIFKGFKIEVPSYCDKIDCDKIKDVNIEDASTAEKRVTVMRLLAVGVFALAWRKKKKNELSFCVIEWTDGRFSHETIFEFSGSGAMQKGYKLRNAIIERI
jgi:hypothetical protein